VRLGVPSDRRSWPEPFEIDDFVEPLGGVEALAEYEPAGAGTNGSTVGIDDQRRWNEGQPVFRVRQGYDRGGYLGLVIGSVDVGTIGVMILPVLGLAIGIAMGVGFFFGLRGLVRRYALPRCSNPECSVRLPPTAATCPACGGLICGVIDGPHQRLAAEEAWLERQGRGEEVR
jgi:hypothetical protein